MNKVVKSLLVGGNIWYFGEGMFGPLFAVFTERIGGDIFDITWAWATYLVVTGLCFIIVGKVVDGHRYAPKVMVAGYALNAVCTFGYLFVSSPWHLFVVQTGLGLANALATPTWNALYARYENKKHDTYAWGLASGGASIVTGVAIVLGGFIVKYVSFSALFVIMGCVQVVATLYQARILRLR